MKKLIIITGVSGVGKSSLAKEIYNRLPNSTLLSLDILKENIYDMVGFKDISQKKSLSKLSTKLYKNIIRECLNRNDEVVILEYPFSRKRWITFFNNLLVKYDYEVYTINLFAKNYDVIWERLKIRENSKYRHPSHYLSSYDYRKKEEYSPFFEFIYKKHKKEYDNLIPNSINLGKVSNIEDIETLNIDDLIKNIIKN